MTDIEALQMINSNNKASFIALIESTLNNHSQLMSIALLIVDSHNYHIANFNYYIISPEYRVGGKYSYALNLPNTKNQHYSLPYTLKDIVEILSRYHVSDIYGFDIPQSLLSLNELSVYNFYDISKVITQSQYNDYIDDRSCDEQGFLKGPRDLNALLVVVKGDYSITHNALLDVVTMLELMQLLHLPFKIYKKYKVEKEESVVPSMSSDHQDLILPELDDLTVAQTAHILMTTEYEVNQLIINKKIKSKSIYGVKYISKDEIRRYIDKKRRLNSFKKRFLLYLFALIAIIGIFLAIIFM